VAWLRRGERSGQQKAGTTPSFSSAISFALQSWRHLQNLGAIAPRKHTPLSAPLAGQGADG
jgi:hypothetical protein